MYVSNLSHEGLGVKNQPIVYIYLLLQTSGYKFSLAALQSIFWFDSREFIFIFTAECILTFICTAGYVFTFICTAGFTFIRTAGYISTFICTSCREYIYFYLYCRVYIYIYLYCRVYVYFYLYCRVYIYFYLHCMIYIYFYMYCRVYIYFSLLQGNMRKHLEGVHIVDLPLPCQLCGKVFKNKNTLSNHISLTHRR